MNLNKAFSFLLLPALVFAGCNSLSNVDYHNSVSKNVLILSESVDVTLSTYDSAVPVSIDAYTSVDVSEMNMVHAEAVNHLDQMQESLFLESFDKKQQEAVRASLEAYLDETGGYLDVYGEMLQFYFDDFPDDLEKVVSLDDELFVLYNAHVDAHNDLANVLEQY